VGSVNTKKRLAYQYSFVMVIQITLINFKGNFTIVGYGHCIHSVITYDAVDQF